MSLPTHGRIAVLVPSFLSLLSAADLVVVAEPAPMATTTVDSARQEAALIPGGTAVIDSESLSTSRAVTWRDTLGNAAGVYVQPRFGAEESRLSIRGSGLQRTFHMRGLQLLNDGIPVNLADGSADFQSVDPRLADHVVVYRGAAGQALGAATLGGAIDVRSPTGRGEHADQLSAEGGSFGYGRLTAAGGGADADIDGWAGITAYHARGFRDHSRTQDQRASTNVGVRLADGVENRTFLSASNSISELPGALTRAQMEADPAQANATQVAGNQHRDFPLVRAADRLVWERAGHRLETAVTYSWKHLDHPIFEVIDQLSHDGQGSARWTFRDGGNRLSVLALHGVGLIRAEQYRNVRGDRGALTQDGYQRASNSVLDVGDELAIAERTFLSAGVQASRQTRSYDDHLWGGAYGQDNSDSLEWRSLSPRAGIRHRLAVGDIYANLSRAVEAPTFGELSNLAGGGLYRLETQKSTTAELGTRGDEAGTAWDASLYYAWVRDELLSHVDPALGTTTTTNVDRTVHAGVESMAETHVAEHVRLRGTYLFSWFRFADDSQYGNDGIAGIPAHSGRIEVLYERGGWAAGPTVDAASAGWLDHANTAEAPGWTTLGLKASYRAKPGLTAWVEARNLLNATYAATYNPVDRATAASAILYPGDGRAFYGGAGWTW